MLEALTRVRFPCVTHAQEVYNVPGLPPTRRFSAGNSECPTITKRKLCSAHVLLMVCESDVARTSYPAFSSAVMRTSVRFGSCETTKILSRCVIYVWMPSVPGEAFAVPLRISTLTKTKPLISLLLRCKVAILRSNDWRCNLSTKRQSRRTDDQDGVLISPRFSLNGPTANAPGIPGLLGLLTVPLS
jgi:hypothetical protein